MTCITVNYQNGDAKLKNHGCGLNSHSIGAARRTWGSRQQRRRQARLTHLQRPGRPGIREG